MIWNTVVVSTEGSSHRSNGLPCQDYGSFCVLEDNTLVGAIADGAGSARFADRAAFLAVHAAIASLKTRHTDFSAFNEEGIKDLFHETLVFTASLLKQAARIVECPVHEWACTLIAFVAMPQRFAAMHIGDGFLVVQWEDEKDPNLLFRPWHGEYVNETVFVIYEDASKEMQWGVWDLRPSLICASTDGLEQVAIDCKSWEAFPPFFKPLEDYMAGLPQPDQAKKDLLELLRSDRFDHKTSDDRTLLLSYCKSNDSRGSQ